jgi:hypothetical protein
MQQKGKKLSCRKLRPGPLFVSEMTNSLPPYENNGGVHVHVEEAAAAGRLHCEMIAVLQQRRPEIDCRFYKTLVPIMFSYKHQLNHS